MAQTAKNITPTAVFITSGAISAASVVGRFTVAKWKTDPTANHIKSKIPSTGLFDSSPSTHRLASIRGPTLIDSRRVDLPNLGSYFIDVDSLSWPFSFTRSLQPLIFREFCQALGFY